MHRKQAEMNAAIELETNGTGVDWDRRGGALHNCSWLIDGVSYDGETIHMFINRTGSYTVQLRVRDSWVHVGTVEVKRVRREIYELTSNQC